MKRLLSLLIIINAILVFLGFGLFYLSEMYPFQPGDSLFGVQNSAETWRLRLSARGEKQTTLAINLAERHLVHLASIEGNENLDETIIAFEKALDQAINYVNAAEEYPSYKSDISPDFKMLLSKAQLVVYSLAKKVDNNELLENLKVKIEDQIEISPPTEPADVVNHATNQQAPMVIKSEIISFLGQEVDHSIYPLNGKHQTTDCLLCHFSGEYANTPTECESCHTEFAGPFENEETTLINLVNSGNLEPSQIYLYHFDGACDDCHNEESWQPTSFDHENIIECRSCHVEETPVSTAVTKDLHEVYPIQCKTCHEDVESWDEIIYTHDGITECLSCHEADEPDEHYTESTCATCHTEVEDWNIFEFDHTGYPDCASCHQPSTVHYLGTCSTCHGNTNDWYDYDFFHIGMNDCKTCHILEENHYSGQCSNCHTKEAWLPANFKHGGYTVYQCITCHRKDEPSNHYSNTCGHCHNTNSWYQVHFNHTGLTNCQSCHSGPSGHYDGQCSNCHNTNSWSNYNFNHTGLTDCVSCHSGPNGHYGEECSNCHNTNSWNDYNFNHTGLTDCVSCHTSPDGHYAGQCSNCHNTNSWNNYNFDHLNLNDCQSCHTAPSGHYSGQCSDCHNTSNWTNVNFSHSGAQNCSGCHQPPNYHYSGQCSNCHISTSNWLKIELDHSGGFSDCKACHGDERPESPHPSNGQCSRCHTTDGWLPIKETSTPEPTDTPVPTTETPVPTTETPAPTTETPVPTTETPVPTTETPVPTTETPAPTPTVYHHEGEDCSECHD